MVRLEENKSLTEHRAIEKLPLPKKVYLPLSQHIGKVCSAEVKPQDNVLVGQRIAKAEAHVFSPIHASISGKVAAIQDWPHPVLGRCKAIVIESDGSDSSLAHEFMSSSEKIQSLTSEQIRSIIFDAGIVGMGGASFPAHIKLNPPKPVDTLIINGAECEPYLTADSRLMAEKTKEIIKGIELAARCLGVKNVYVAIEENKPEAIKAFTQELRSSGAPELKILKSYYPQGGEKQLIKNVLNKEVPSGKLPFDIGVVVHNVATVFAIYEAVYLNKPLYERVVTVTGDCIAKPGNYLVRIGTTVRELIENCGPLTKEPQKIIFGGPMMGIAQFSLEVPVIKSTNGVVLLSAQEAPSAEEEFCIRCGACIRGCPANLMPTMINLAARKEMWPETKKFGALDCIECGICSYVCPSNINLVQSIKRAKLEAIK